MIPKWTPFYGFLRKKIHFKIFAWAIAWVYLFFDLLRTSIFSRQFISSLAASRQRLIFRITLTAYFLLVLTSRHSSTFPKVPSPNVVSIWSKRFLSKSVSIPDHSVDQNESILTFVNTYKIILALSLSHKDDLTCRFGSTAVKIMCL